MAIISNSYCINEQCKDFGLKNSDNVRTRGLFGKDKKRRLLYCTTCGKRFSESQTTAFFGSRLDQAKIDQIILMSARGEGIRSIGRHLGIDKDTVNRTVLRAERHCSVVISSLLGSLRLGDSQLDTLLAFLKHRGVLKNRPVRTSQEQTGDKQHH